MSQKLEKPVLSGQRIKTRKRDEKEKYDPAGFRDAVLVGLNKAGNDLEAIYKFLDTAGSKLDYRRYGEALFDILIAGGLLMPGGSIQLEGDKVCKWGSCIFDASEEMDMMHSYEQVFVKLMRRYKYLEKMFVDEMNKILVYLKGFTESERTKLARMTGLWLANGSIPPSVLLVMLNEHQVKDSLALDFLLEVFVTFKNEKGLPSLMMACKKGGLEGRLLDFFPSNKRGDDNFKLTFDEKGLGEVVKLHKAQASQEAKRDMQQQLEDLFAEGHPIKELVSEIRECSNRMEVPESDVISIIWTCVMNEAEWNKKEELVGEQALKHLKAYTPLFAAFTSIAKSELCLMLRVQEYCYGNMNFMKVFSKIIMLFYRTDVLSEEVILRWYKEGHSGKGKMMFLDQMKKFIEWLQNAEEESESGEDED